MRIINHAAHFESYNDKRLLVKELLRGHYARNNGHMFHIPDVHLSNIYVKRYCKRVTARIPSPVNISSFLAEHPRFHHHPRAFPLSLPSFIYLIPSNAIAKRGESLNSRMQSVLYCLALLCCSSCAATPLWIDTLQLSLAHPFVGGTNVRAAYVLHKDLLTASMLTHFRLQEASIIPDGRSISKSPLTKEILLITVIPKALLFETILFCHPSFILGQKEPNAY